MNEENNDQEEAHRKEIPQGEGGRQESQLSTPSIVVAAVIILLLGAMAVPSFNKVRTTEREKSLLNNLRQIASAADSYFIEGGATIAHMTDIIGTDLYVKQLPASIAGERYEILFPITTGFTRLEVSKADGVTVRYTQ